MTLSNNSKFKSSKDILRGGQAKSLYFRGLLKSIGSENHDPVDVNKVDQYVEDEAME